MGNCLKTQLKEVVNDENLKKLGKLRINFTQAQATEKKFYLQFGEAMQGKNVDIYTSAGVLVKTIQLGYAGSISNSQMQDVNSAGYIEINDKYLISELNMGQYTDGQVDLDDVSYCNITSYLVALNPKSGSLKNLPNTITNINLDNATYSNPDGETVTGELADFVNWPNLTSITLYLTKVSGNLADLQGKTSLNTININSNYITGDIKLFFDAQYAAGKHSGSTTIRSFSTMYYDGEQFSGTKAANFTSEGWTLA